MTGPRQEWDVFVSHSHTDETSAARIADALTSAGLRVFRAVGAVDTFTSISTAVMGALRHSRLLLACYSATYPTRSACQHEFATAYLAGNADGDPLARIAAVNLEATLDHIEPRQLRDALLPTLTAIGSLDQLAEAVTTRARGTTGTIGDAAEVPPRWLAGRPVRPPNTFAGRWKELWWLHSALHPHVGPLTSPPTQPVAIVHGPAGIGKTALVAEYLRRFGAAFPGGIHWRGRDNAAMSEPPPPGTHWLWILDDAVGDPDQVSALLPADPDVLCLIMTRDARLAKLGNALALTDLSTADSVQLLAANGLREGRLGSSGITELVDATDGSPGLRGRVAELADAIGAQATLSRLHRSADLLRPVAERLTPELASCGELGWDVLRVLAAASPAVVPILRIADILAMHAGSDRVHQIVPVQEVVTALLARGVLAAEPDAVELTVPSALVLALRHLDPHPHRAEQLRMATVRTLAQQGNQLTTRSAPEKPVIYRDEEQRAAHRLQTELRNRVTGHPLAYHEGSLRDALNSLHELVRITRSIQGQLHPAVLRESRLGPVTDRLINVVLRTPLTRWHVTLGAHEDVRPPGVSRHAHERQWSQHDALRDTLAEIHAEAETIVAELGEITGNPTVRHGS